MSNEALQLRDMAAQILTRDSKSKALLQFAANAVDERDELRDKLRLKQVEIDVCDAGFSLHLKRANEAEAELAQFHAAMERERSPDWEKEHKDLADRLERYSKMKKCRQNEPSLEDEFVINLNTDLVTAAKELRYMADCFTLKANFVPTKLMLEEARRLLSDVDIHDPKWRKRREDWENGVMPEIYEMPNPLIDALKEAGVALEWLDAFSGLFEGNRINKALVELK